MIQVFPTLLERRGEHLDHDLPDHARNARDPKGARKRKTRGARGDVNGVGSAGPR
ncbi:hypothetical protein J2S43_004997 [Catenuloplanes nepalensis]|uniref:Uncharacterized protein n=1 Tax=Catenuloplanes nepalensis TaxID=587533 RepID=A0ABT9MYP8_9ACTN|nr:hypothetical protein [Catenuloplanes nepalensis]